MIGRSWKFALIVLVGFPTGRYHGKGQFDHDQQHEDSELHHVICTFVERGWQLIFWSGSRRVNRQGYVPLSMPWKRLRSLSFVLTSHTCTSIAAVVLIRAWVTDTHNQGLSES